MATAVALKTESDLFFEQLSRAKSSALLLDYDRTIAPYSAYRSRAFPNLELPELIDSIMCTCRTRVALISSRSARQIPPLLGFRPHPEIWGADGIERLQADGRYSRAEIGAEAEESLSKAEGLLREQGLEPLCEPKAGAIAVHCSGLPPAQAEEVRTRAYRLLSPLALKTGLNLAEFDGGVELRVRTHGKAEAVRTVLSEIDAGVPVAFLGDDSNGEDAFRTVNDRGLTVLVRTTYRFTAAHVWIRPPEELVQFLSNWVYACGGEM